ncbi:MAG TPA: dihydroorotase, partial [Rhizobium sp.]
GSDADILVVDMNRSVVITDEEQVSRAAYTPFHGRRAAGRLIDVFLRGERIVKDGTLITPGRGQVVRRAA